MRVVAEKGWAWSMAWVPAGLVAFRAVCGPLLLLAHAGGAGGWMLAGLVTAAFLSDVFDGIIARRLGVATQGLRRADSLVDTVFYVCALAALVQRAPAVIAHHAVGIAVLVGLEVIRFAVERFRYGRMAAYHMWSAKAWGITLWLGFSEAFVTGQPGPLVQAAVVLGILADLEGLAASTVLSRWQHDVPTLWHALRIERGSGRAR